MVLAGGTCVVAAVQEQPCSNPLPPAPLPNAQTKSVIVPLPKSKEQRSWVIM